MLSIPEILKQAQYIENKYENDLLSINFPYEDTYQSRQEGDEDEDGKFYEENVRELAAGGYIGDINQSLTNERDRYCNMKKDLLVVDEKKRISINE